MGRSISTRLTVVLVFAVLAAAGPGARAASARVAVASNFADAMATLTIAFEHAHPHRLTITPGATGKLYAQIRQGAPFDVLLAADSARPQRLEADGDAVAGSRFTYALGRLALWSSDPGAIGSNGVDALRTLGNGRLALANPALAPYGVAALQTLEYVGLLDPLRAQLVYGENVGQAWAMVATGNAHLGLVARAQLLRPAAAGGSSWDVPVAAHAPIRQDAVLLRRGAANAAARTFVNWLGSEPARAIVRASGYDLP